MDSSIFVNRSVNSLFLVSNFSISFCCCFFSWCISIGVGGSISNEGMAFSSYSFL